MKLEHIVDDLSENTKEGEVRRVEHRVAEGTAPVVVGGRQWRGLTMAAGLAGGAVLTVMGAIAISRGDTSGSWSQPIVEVNGWPHSPMLGLLEIIAGAALILLSMSAAGVLLSGLVVGGFGTVALMEPTVLDDQLTIAAANASLLAAIGAVAVVAGAFSMSLRRPEGPQVYHLEEQVRERSS